MNMMSTNKMLKLENELTCKSFNMILSNQGCGLLLFMRKRKWLGRVLEKRGSQVKVQYLEKLFGVKGPRKLESDHKAISYFQVYKKDVIPRQFSSSTGGKLLYSSGGSKELWA